MSTREIIAKSILTKRKSIDSWFLSAMSMNLYRGCGHACAYCDGRDEKYRVEGDFERDIAVKINAPSLLRRELDPKRKRVPLPNGFVLLGGGVSDSWQPLEAETKIARAVLGVILESNLPVHVLTKSRLVLRDLDLLKQIHEQRRAVVSVSFSSVDEEISRLVEPNASSPADRLDVLRQCTASGIPCGAFLMPVIPGITDTEAQMKRSVEALASAGAEFVIFGGMTLKSGRQQTHFERVVLERKPELKEGYRKIYPQNPYGSAIPGYYDKIHRRFFPLAREGMLPVRMPDTLFGDLVSPNERAVILLEHMDYLCRAEGRKSGFGRAAYLLRKIGGALPPMPAGMGKEAAKTVLEIGETGTSREYRRMLFYGAK